MKRLCLVVGCAVSLWPGASAWGSPTVEDLLDGTSSPAALRAALLEFVTTAPETAVASKGAALFYAGLSSERSGHPDSALSLYEQAVAVRGAMAERDGYVDALLQRGRPGDAKRALEVLGPRLAAAQQTSERDFATTTGRQAWAYYVDGRGDTALALMRSQERRLLDDFTPHHRDWRYRLGLLELEHGDPEKSTQLLLRLAVESRFQDRDVMGMLRDASQKMPQSQISGLLRQELGRIDDLASKEIAALGGRRVIFPAADGYTVAGVAFAPTGPAARRAAIVVMDPEESFDAYDSLATGLARAGYAVLLIEPRGSGMSVAPTCPLPDTWRGREEALQAEVAADVGPGLRALAATAAVDTARYALIGASGSVTIVAEAAAADPRAQAVVLLRPEPSPVDRGRLRARLAEAGRPVYFSIPVMDAETLPLAETLYRTLDPRRSRISESEIVGSGARLFQHDPAALPRLLQWLGESLAGPVDGKPRGSRR